MNLKLYQANLAIPSSGLLLARDEKEAERIVWRSMARLLEERGEAAVTFTEAVDPNWDGDTLLLEGGLTLDGALAALALASPEAA